ncbi:MAG: hypothetical protein JXQ90_10750 [Cyclobacteriaceae bacterium]
MKYSIIILSLAITNICFGQERLVVPQGGLHVGFTTIGAFYELPVGEKSLLHLTVESKSGYAGLFGAFHGMQGAFSFRHYLLTEKAQNANSGFFMETAIFTAIKGHNEIFGNGGSDWDIRFGVGYRHVLNKRLFLEGAVGNAYRVWGDWAPRENAVNPYIGFKLGASLLKGTSK